MPERPPSVKVVLSAEESDAPASDTLAPPRVSERSARSKPDTRSENAIETVPTAVADVPDDAGVSTAVGAVASSVVYCSCTQSTVVFAEKARFSVPSWRLASCAAERVSSRDVALVSSVAQPRLE